MRQIVSSGSVKAISLNREGVIRKLTLLAEEASRAFPAIQEVRLYGSLAKGEESGLSDADLFILTEEEGEDPLERMKPYFNFFSDRAGLAIDLIVATKREAESLQEFLAGSRRLYPMEKKP